MGGRGGGGARRRVEENACLLSILELEPETSAVQHLLLPLQIECNRHALTRGECMGRMQAAPSVQSPSVLK